MPRKNRKKKKIEKIIEQSKDGKVRVPRLSGQTLRAIEISLIPEENKRNKKIDELRQYVLDQIVSTGMELNGRIIGITELAKYINLPVERTMIRMNRTMERIGGILKGRDGLEFARVQFFGSFFRSLTIGTQLANQANMLVAKQGGEYVPFLSSAANQALKNWSDSQKPTMDLLKMLLEATKTTELNAFQPAGLTANGLNESYLSTDEALKLIQEQKQTMLDNPALLEDKYIQLQIENNTKEVRANFQDLTTIGIKHDGTYQVSKDVPNIPNEVLEAEDFVG